MCFIPCCCPAVYFRNMEKMTGRSYESSCLVGCLLTCCCYMVRCAAVRKSRGLQRNSQAISAAQCWLKAASLHLHRSLLACATLSCLPAPAELVLLRPAPHGIPREVRHPRQRLQRLLPVPLRLQLLHLPGRQRAAGGGLVRALHRKPCNAHVLNV